MTQPREIYPMIRTFACFPQKPKTVGISRLGLKPFHHEYGAFNQGAQAFFSGNRIFMRSYTDVYCVGDKSQAMTLSEAHR